MEMNRIYTPAPALLVRENGKDITLPFIPPIKGGR